VQAFQAMIPRGTSIKTKAMAAKIPSPVSIQEVRGAEST
jgi:hypothetical protein